MDNVLTLLSVVDPDNPSIIEQLIPFWPGLVTLLGFFIVGAFAVWNRKRGNVENQAPSTVESWKEADNARRAKRLIEDMFWQMRNGWQGYYRRVNVGQHEHPLTTREQKIIDSRLPDDA